MTEKKINRTLLYPGRRIEELTREELIEAMYEISVMYEIQLQILKGLLELRKAANDHR